MATKDKSVIFVAYSTIGDDLSTAKKILEICSEIYGEEHIPTVPYLASLLSGDKMLGVEMSLLTLSLERTDNGHRRQFVDQVWLYGDHISEVLKVVISFALNRNIPVVPKNEVMKKEFGSVFEGR